jgi:hypothetical protein
MLTRESVTELGKYETVLSLAVRFIPQIGCIVVLDKADNRLFPPPDSSGRGSVATSHSLPGAGGAPHWTAAGYGAHVAPDAAVVPAEFDFLFESATELHFKNPRMHELDKVGLLPAVHDRRILYLHDLFD